MNIRMHFPLKNFFLKLISEVAPYKIIKIIISIPKSINNTKSSSQICKYNFFFKRINKLYRKLKKLLEIIDILEDDYSKKILIRIMVAYTYGFSTTIISPRTNMILKLNKKDTYEKIEKLIKKEDIFSSGRFNLNYYDLTEIGFPIKICDDHMGIISTFILQQYRYNHKKLIEVEKGDYVIDAGGAFGNTALYFSSKVRNNGQVYSFDFINSNIKIFQKNLSLNPELSDIIQLIKKPLWNVSDNKLFFIEDGTGSRITTQQLSSSHNTVKTISIDDFVKRYKIPKINFIKMDIEGAELKALEGAKETLIRFKPKLAISVYHDLKHYYKIPQYINSLNLNYKMYLDHFSKKRAESVLFALVA